MAVLQQAPAGATERQPGLAIGFSLRRYYGWQIENVFQQVTEVFALRHLIGSAPRATVFQAALCLVIYNVLQLLRGYIAQGRPEPTPVADLSAEQIFEDLRKDLVGLHEVLAV